MSGYLSLDDRRRLEGLIAEDLRGAVVTESQPIVGGYGDVDIQEVVLRLQDGREISPSIEFLRDEPRIVPETYPTEDAGHPSSLRRWRAMRVEDFPGCASL